MSILHFPDKALFKQCEDVYSFDVFLIETLDSMWKIMKFHRGMGLAANQIGVPYNMFVMEGPDGKRIDLINPYICMKSEEKIALKEGCLSAPGEMIVVPGRSKWVQVSYQNDEGKRKKAIFTGIYAVCVQHELEHLEGKSFMEHKSISRDDRKKLAKKWGLKR